MIDSTDEKVVERALTYCQGKAIINSINLEDGEERFHKVVQLARRYGAALIVGCIDETGMAVSRGRKLEVAERSHALRFVGREAELARIDEAWDRAEAQASCELVTVVGDAGVGKSRLVWELVRGFAAAVTVLRGRCLPYGEGIT